MTPTVTYPPSCDCQTCRSMCEVRPCWGNPRQILHLITSDPTPEHQIAKKLMRDYWTGTKETQNRDVSIVSPAIIGYESQQAPLWPSGSCTLYQNGKCTIHDHKPFTGRIAYHAPLTDRKTDHKVERNYHKDTAMSWNTKRGEKVFKIWSQLTNY